MNITKDVLIKAVNEYAKKVHEIVHKEGEYTPTDLEEIQELTDTIFSSCAEWDLSFEDELDNLQQFFVLHLVRNLSLAAALCWASDKANNKKMIDATRKHFNIHLAGLREGVCAYYHKILENRKVN